MYVDNVFSLGSVPNGHNLRACEVFDDVDELAHRFWQLAGLLAVLPPVAAGEDVGIFKW